MKNIFYACTILTLSSVSLFSKSYIPKDATPSSEWPTETVEFANIPQGKDKKSIDEKIYNFIKKNSTKCQKIANKKTRRAEKSKPGGRDIERPGRSDRKKGKELMWRYSKGTKKNGQPRGRIYRIKTTPAKKEKK
jgi:hypothetical protein